MPEEEEGPSLKMIVESILRALREAKYLGDIESAKLHETYEKEKALSPFRVPAFAISDVDIELRFAIAEPSRLLEKENEISDLRVKVSPASLEGLEAHQVQTMRLKISPITMRVLEEGK